VNSPNAIILTCDASFAYFGVAAMTEDEVHNFLLANPDFLDDFVLKHVSEDTLDKWKENKKRDVYQQMTNGNYRKRNS
jgi:hypothetical protein